jgi:hypothetical protein
MLTLPNVERSLLRAPDTCTCGSEAAVAAGTIAYQ